MKYYACLLDFNNYFNRIIKGYDNLADYVANAKASFTYTQPVNYNPRDGISSELVMNDCPFQANYLLILDDNNNIIDRWFILETVFTREGQYRHTLRNDVIYNHINELLELPMFVHKAYLRDDDMFIFNDEGMSFNQVKIEERLLKDDSESAWIAMYIAKNAAASDITITTDSGKITGAVTLSDVATDVGISEATLNSLMNIDGGNQTPCSSAARIDYKFATDIMLGSVLLRKPKVWIQTNGDVSARIGSTGVSSLDTDIPIALYKVTLPSPQGADSALAELGEAIVDQIILNKATFISQIPTITDNQIINYLTQTQINKLWNYVGKIIEYNGAYFRFSIQQQNSTISSAGFNFGYSTVSSVSSAVATASAAEGYTSYLVNSGQYHINFRSLKDYFLHLDTLSPADYENEGDIPVITTKISSSRNKTVDQAFDLLVAPLNKMRIGPHDYVQEGLARVLAAKIATTLDAACYDVQLLPYCPIPQYIKNKGQISFSELTENVDFNYVRMTIHESYEGEVEGLTEDSDVGDGWCLASGSIILDAKYSDFVSLDSLTAIAGEDYIRGTIAHSESSYLSTKTKVQVVVEAQRSHLSDIIIKAVGIFSNLKRVGAIFYVKDATFSTVIHSSLTSSSDNVKVENLCYKYRLCSPNYQGSFEFNLAKNGGYAEFFIAECTYKPYTPYIKVAPQFNLLYGTNFGDVRGLVCGGDYSLPRFTSAWETYELNNKNYQNIFNRDIQNLEFRQSIEMLLQNISGGSGILSSGAAGAGAGASVGGGYGAIAGAAVGLAGGTVGAVMDPQLLYHQQKEARDFAIDKFNYQLGNIKALPYTITKVGAFDANSKIWPFLEIYSATEEEQEALINKIAYESMTVMRIDKMINYYQAYDTPRYFKAELIRNTLFSGDSHHLEAIYGELMKGVYI